MKAEARKLYNFREVELSPSRNMYPQPQKRSGIRLHRLMLTLLYLSLFVVSGIYFFNQHQLVSTKEKELKQLQMQETRLAKNEKELNREIRLLNDPDFIANYARDQYMFSKKGETIVIVPKTSKELQFDDK